MIVALFPSKKKKQSFELAAGIKNFLEKHQIDIVAEDESAHQLAVKSLSSIDTKKIKFFIAIGGDGTILSLSHKYPDIDAAILGINLGHVGFMADIPAADVYHSLQDLIKEAYTVEKRLMIECSYQDKPIYAANDIVIHRAHNPSLIELAIYVDGMYFNTFSSDGIIIATPNGSTAYSLAAGGPILSPQLDAFVLTPISPHTISNRPIVLTASHEIEVQALSNTTHPIEIRADGIKTFPIKTKEIVKFKKSKKTFNLMDAEIFDSVLRTTADCQ